MHCRRSLLYFLFSFLTFVPQQIKELHDMNLQQGTLLQGGKYCIERELGHGGFGVTYLAIQKGLNRYVAIKEFFMSEYCNRDSDTSYVTVPSEGSRELVAKFRNKFVKEAQNIACLKHPHIISIHDVFEENGTAYYVMEYLDHGSLADVVKRQGALPVADALRYTRQIADALRYIHARKMNHLDVKPGNILIDEEDQAVLIDFGLSKRYDAEGNQTSTTPVGISHGYAPLEQYKKGGVGTFSPATDIYSLGATLYKLVTGATPPDANDVGEEGLPAFPEYVPTAIVKAIEQAMQFRRKDRPQTTEEFLALLDGEVTSASSDTSTTVEEEDVATKVIAGSAVSIDDEKCNNVEQSEGGITSPHTKSSSFSSKKLLLPLLVCAVAVAVFFGVRACSNHRAEMARVAAIEQQRLDSIAQAEEAARLALLEQQRKDSIEAAAAKVLPKLFVTTQPTGATVSIDGKQVGKTPIKEVEIAKGKHTIKIALKGYETLTLSQTAGSEPVVINEVLTKVEEKNAEPTIIVETSISEITTTPSSTTVATTTTTTTTKGTSSVAVDSKYKDTYPLFFPVFGVLPGKTTVSDVKAWGYYVDNSYSESYNTRINSIAFWDHDGDRVFKDIYMTKGDSGMPAKWEKSGLNWRLSYDEWVALFQKLGFTINHVKSPITVEYSGRKTLQAQFVATAPDQTFSMELGFNYGNDNGEGYSTKSKGSLYSISVKLLKQPSTFPASNAKSVSVSSVPTIDRGFYDFFPVYNVTLGRSTISDVKSLGYAVENNKNASVNALTFWDHNGDRVFEEIYFVRSGMMPEKWMQLGLNWRLSYNDWVKLFQKMGFTIEYSGSPTVQSNAFSARFTATSSDQSFTMELNFNYGNENGDGCTANSKGSLYSISVRKK